MSRVLGLVVVALVAVACGGDADDPSATPDSPSTSQSPPTSASPSAPDRSDSAIDAAADLSDFVCEPDDEGEWNASGVITNSSAKPADYRVTVVVSDGPGVSVAGLRRTLTELSPGSPEPFDVKAIPASGDADPVCQVEVLRLP